MSERSAADRKLVHERPYTAVESRLLDALEAAERKRDEAYQHVANHMIARRAAEVRTEDVLTERDEARDEVTRLREMLANWNEHLGGCSAGRSKLPCKCGVEEARAELEPPRA